MLLLPPPQPRVSLLERVRVRVCVYVRFSEKLEEVGKEAEEALQAGKLGKGRNNINTTGAILTQGEKEEENEREWQSVL